ncbi:MAG TPA: ectonucleotide pyrophosphatase/phosphodiesterase [Pyrinomonadaceae bacterium]|jgi:predicted AlkP superfamily pyrophosphatase or phosphodiesterase
MKRRFFLLFLALFLFRVCVSAQVAPVKDLKPTVILVSIDGFRYDYLDKYKPPTLNRLASEGVRAKWMIPSFPTKTFPNHYTIATGLYPAHHGIIENNIYDFGATFSMSKREEVQNSRWWLGEPIWVTAEKNGQRAGAFFFPGTETKIEGVIPSYWNAYDGKIPNDERVDSVLRWLDYPQKFRPTILTLYFNDVDEAGHHFSPDSDETRRAILTVDGNIKRLVEGLEARKIDKKVNLIILSDHGMATVDLHNAVLLDDYFSFDLTERILWTNEIVQIFPKTGKLDEIMEKLKNISHAACWKKENIPARFHYQDSPRIAPVICLAEEPWILTSQKRYENLKKDEDFSIIHGEHGYDNANESMRATFIAHGKAFKKNLLVEPFSNVNVYNLMCDILGLAPAPNDGDFQIVRGMLKNPKMKTSPSLIKIETKSE